MGANTKKATACLTDTRQAPCLLGVSELGQQREGNSSVTLPVSA